jgi:glycine cleavage system protein P-like pyridoxal-binding family
MYWRAMHNNAFADGDHLAAKLYKAKELVVHATNHPITTFGGSVPRLCIEGQLESKSEEELDELIEILSSLSKEKREELRKLQ